MEECFSSFFNVEHVQTFILHIRFSIFGCVLFPNFSHTLCTWNELFENLEMYLVISFNFIN